MADLAQCCKEFAVTVTDPNKHTGKRGVEKSRNTPTSHTTAAHDQTLTNVPFTKSALALKFDRVVTLGAESMPNGMCPSETYLG